MKIPDFLRNVLPETKGTRALFFLYSISVVLLFFYSFTQIDLSLTLTRTSFVQPIQQGFQWIGYFNRPLSAFLYVSIILLLFVSFLFLVRDAFRGRLRNRSVWFLILFSTVFLVFSYTAFSYDLFNYIFDAKIITYYQENPYIKKALDYPGDPMLSFMHWTHRVYPYGPSWLLFTVPLSFVGMQYFVLTYFLFKIAIGVCFIGTCYFLQKIAHKLYPGSSAGVLVLFALNPLVIIESLISGHNDIVMMFFAVMSFWFLLEKKWLFAFFALCFSIGIKFATGLLLPVFLLMVYLSSRGKKYDSGKLVPVMVVLMVFAVLAASLRTNFQPWYLLYALPFASLLAQKAYVRITVYILTFCALLQYVPFLYLGNWDPPVPVILNSIMLSGVALSSFVFLYLFLFHRSHATNNE